MDALIETLSSHFTAHNLGMGIWANLYKKESDTYDGT
jgi:hypothetical protein